MAEALQIVRFRPKTDLAPDEVLAMSATFQTVVSD